MLCLILNEETIVIKILIFQDNRQDKIGIKKINHLIMILRQEILKLQRINLKTIELIIIHFYKISNNQWRTKRCIVGIICLGGIVSWLAIKILPF